MIEFCTHVAVGFLGGFLAVAAFYGLTWLVFEGYMLGERWGIW